MGIFRRRKLQFSQLWARSWKLSSQILHVRATHIRSIVWICESFTREIFMLIIFVKVFSFENFHYTIRVRAFFSTYQRTACIYRDVYPRIPTESPRTLHYCILSHMCCHDFQFAVKVLQFMSHVKWDVKDIMSQHNNYVDFLLQVILIYVRLKWPVSTAWFMVCILQEFNQLSMRLVKIERFVLNYYLCKKNIDITRYIYIIGVFASHRKPITCCGSVL